MRKFNSDKEAADSLHQAYLGLNHEISKIIIGQDEVVRLVLTAIFSQGSTRASGT